MNSLILRRTLIVLGPIATAAWWSNGTQIVTASWDRTVKLWDVEKASALHTLEGNNNKHKCKHTIRYIRYIWSYENRSHFYG